jgi:YHS domain-containing protein
MKPRRKQLFIAALLTGALVFLMFAAISCKKKSQPTESTTPTMEKMAQKATETAKEAAKSMEQTTCPVMDGNPINKDVFVEYKGKKVYFCCPDCKAKFDADPEKYIAKLPQFQQ